MDLNSLPVTGKVKLDFPLPHCNIGQIYKANLTFRVIEMSMIGTTIEILDLSTGQGENEIRKETTPIRSVVPSPS